VRHQPGRGRLTSAQIDLFVVPCHRVLRGDGNLGGYHWGLTRKRALIGWETGRVAGRG
jgi:AraC family transcriptional regulator of adaptative response/methylated-DNA-[protein]-cysteine methyltransferase